MKKKLTNTRVINSIGIGILAMVTAGTPVLAEINDAVNNNSMADTNVSDIPAEPVEQAAPSQNEQILQTLTDTQGMIQEVRDNLALTPENSTADTEETGAPGEIPPVEGSGTPVETIPVEENTGGDNITPPTPEAITTPIDGSQTSADGSQTSGDGVTGDEGTTTEQTPTEGTENPPADEGVGDTKNGDVTQETDTETQETVAQEIDKYLEQSQKALGSLENSFRELDEKNQEAQEAVKNYNEAVENPNNFVSSVVDIISNASSAVVDTVASITEEEATAREQAQAAVDAQGKVYENQEAAAAAQQQAQAAAEAAEEAYNAAKAAVESAAQNKQIADDRLADLENQLSNADAAVRDMEIKVQDAQEMLISILKQYGLTPEEFNSEDLKGEAETAYKSAVQAVDLAQSELESAQKNYQGLIGQVEAAKKSYEEAAGALNTSNKNMSNAVSNLETKRNEWADAEFDEKIAKYNEGLKGTSQVYLALEDTKAAFDKASEALSKADEINKKAADVLENAQNALDEAIKDETEMSEAAEKAAEKAAAVAKEPDLATEKDIEEAKKAAEEAEAEAAAAAARVERALKVLDSAEKKAADAQEDLKNAIAAVDAAATARDTAQKAYDQLLADWQQAQYDALETQIEAVKKAMEPINNLGEGKTTKDLTGTQKYALAKELIEYKLLCEGKEIKEVKAGDVKTTIIVTDSEDKETIYYFSTVNNPFAVYLYHSGTNAEPFISIDKFNDNVEEITAKKNTLNSAQSELQRLKNQYTVAVQAQDKAEIVQVLTDMRDALMKVGDEAKNLVDTETAYPSNNEQNKLLDTLSTALSNLVSGGDNLNSAKSTLESVEATQKAVEDAIERLTEFTVQEEADQAAYENLLAAYEKASTDHAAAVEALKQCVSGLNRVQTQKDRAKIAADAIFDYISAWPDNNNSSTNNTGTVTPIQPGTLTPIYGTLIDTLTSPILGNTGVSTPSGTTGTGYGYRGYTYTVGGQPVYASGETAAPEEEQAEENLVSVEEAAVPLAEVGENNNRRTTSARNTTNTRKVSDEKIPLADVETENNKISWWWILVIALLGATGTELYIRHQKKEEEERKSRTDKQGYAKI